MRLLAAAFALLYSASLCWSQAEFRVYTKHPRLFLEEERLARLRNDVKRRSQRWQNLEFLRLQGVELPEAPLLAALRFQVADDEAAAAEAAHWLKGVAADPASLSRPDVLRLAAIVYDWIWPALPAEKRASIAAALGAAAQAAAGRQRLDPGALRTAALAAIVVANEWSGSETVLGQLLDVHWEKGLLPAVERGEVAASAVDLSAILELCHAVRHNLDRNLWEDAPEAFRSLPLPRILSYYPQSIETAWGHLRRPSSTSGRKIDEKTEAHAGRIAEMLLVAYENAGQPFQFLQGWLRNDRYTLRDPLGAFYEFLWINPYLPGLSYSSGPVSVYDSLLGRVFARSGWEGDDLWAGYFGDELQILADGEIHIVTPRDRQAPLLAPGAAIVPARLPLKITLRVPKGNPLFGEQVYVVGLEEGRSYEVRINKQDPKRETAGRGGVLVLQNAPKDGQALVRYGEPMRIQVKPL